MDFSRANDLNEQFILTPGNAKVKGVPGARCRHFM
jgi:hypothetical protein